MKIIPIVNSITRSEQLKKLFSAFIERNSQEFLQIANEIINSEEKKNHHLLAKELRKILNNNSKNILNYSNSHKRYKTNIPIPRDTEKGFPLLELREYTLSFNDIILDQESIDILNNIIEEYLYFDIFRTYGINAKQKILFCGPPGTGKTLSAKILSSILKFPLVYIRFDSIISSYLGETASNLRRIFNFIENGEWVVLFDEFDIIGKKRDDPYEHGEIKRIVNNFIQMLDNFRGKSLIIAATNHHYLLDIAIWRRFDEILYFKMPNESLRSLIFKHYTKIFKRNKDINYNELAKKGENLSPADIAQVCQETIKKAILKNSNEIKNDNILLAIKNQRRKKLIIYDQNANKKI